MTSRPAPAHNTVDARVDLHVEERLRRVLRCDHGDDRAAVARERAAFVTALRTLWRDTEDGGTHRHAGWGRSR